LRHPIEFAEHTPQVLLALPNKDLSLHDLDMAIKGVCSKRDDLRKSKLKERELAEVLRRVKNKNLVNNLNFCLLNEIKGFQDRTYSLVEKNLFLGSKPEMSITNLRNLYNMSQNISGSNMTWDYNHIYKVNIALQDTLTHGPNMDFYTKHFDKFSSLENLNSFTIDMSYSKATTASSDVLFRYLGDGLKKMDS
jgi:hypothetical protein